MSNTREQAVKILKESLSQKKFLNIENNETHHNSSEEMKFLNMLCRTAMRHLEGTKQLLKKFLHKELRSKDQDAYFALILGINELLYLNTPDYAVINSYVEIIKKKTNKYIGGMANAILHKIAQQKQTILKEKFPLFSTEFYNILKEDYNKETITQIEQSLLTEPPLTISVKKDISVWSEKLNGKHISNNSIYTFQGGKINDFSGYAEGEWWVQDFAATLAVQSLGTIKKGTKILDLCAAPGGKTAQLLNNGAKVTSLDSSQERLQTLIQNINRLKFPLPRILNEDAQQYLKTSQDEPYDAIILDAPCSATGIFRRHPEIIHLKTYQDIKQQALLQEKILETVSNKLKTSGFLIYCVCSIAKTEGEKQILNFIEKHPEFKIIPIKEKEINSRNDLNLSDLITKEGFIRTLPYMLKEYGGIDSFFIAKLQKVK